jgi:hypothetical protein
MLESQIYVCDFTYDKTAKPTTKSHVIYYEIVMTISDFITDHTDPWQTVRFRHKFPVLDMKPDMKSKHYDILPISS